MTSTAKPRPITASTVPGKAVVKDYYRLLAEISGRDAVGAAVSAKFTAHGYLLDRIVADIERYVAKELEAQAPGRSARRRAADLMRWSEGLLSLLNPWIFGDGHERAKKEASARRASEDLGQAIAATAGKLLDLMERSSGARLANLERSVPHVSIDTALPHLRRDLYRLVDVVTGARRVRRKAQEAKLRSGDGLPVPTTRLHRAYGLQGFVADIDAALPVTSSPVASSAAVADLWQFVSGNVVGESAVRLARERNGDRTKPD